MYIILYIYILFSLLNIPMVLTDIQCGLPTVALASTAFLHFHPWLEGLAPRPHACPQGTEGGQQGRKHFLQPLGPCVFPTPLAHRADDTLPRDSAAGWGSSWTVGGMSRGNRELEPKAVSLWRGSGLTAHPGAGTPAGTQHLPRRGGKGAYAWPHGGPRAALGRGPPAGPPRSSVALSARKSR